MTTPDPFEDAFAAAPEPPATPARSRRDRRHRRDIRRRVIWGTVSGLVVLVLVLVATDTLRMPTGNRPVLAADGTSKLTATEEVTPSRSAFPTRPLTVTAPMRLWIAGDSLAFATGQALGNQTATTGVVKPVYDARVSSGLSQPQFFNWPEHAKKETARLDPDAVVFVIGANDVGVVGGKDWKTTYGAEVDEMMDLLSDNNTRAVYWVGPPTFKDSTRNNASKQMNELMKERAATHKTVTFINGYEVFADEDGKYAAKLDDADDKLVLVRTDDGVHFTAAGGQRLAKVIFTAMDAVWKITAQAVEGAVQTIEQTDGCCRTPSGSNNTQWQTGTTPTRAPASTTKTTTKTTGTTATTAAPAPTSTTAAPTPTTSGT